MRYSRQNPSPGYHNLIIQYQEMHTGKHFQGIGCYRYRKEIRKLVNQTGATTLLDWGVGKARQLSKTHNPEALYSKLGVFAESWMDALGVDEITGYDPGVEKFATPPLGTFGGVYSIDVLEHCLENDLSWIIEEIFSYAEKFVFLTVSTVPAKKNLPNGENAHVTIKSQEWWITLIDGIAKKHPSVRYEIVFEQEKLKEDG